MAETPVSSLSRLMRRLSDLAHEHGLHVVGFTVTPNFDESGPHAAQAVVLPDPEFGAKPKEADPKFDELAEMFRKQDQEEKAAAARKDLQDLSDTLRNSKGGLGLDED